MKWITFLMVCFALNFINVDCQCDLGPSFGYDPEKLQGTWYFDYAIPDIFKTLVKISGLYKFEGDKFDTTVTATLVKEGKEQVYKGILYIIKSNDTINHQSGDLPMFNGEYRVTSTDYNGYGVLRACVPAVSDKEMTLMLFRKRCPDKESENAARKVVQQLGMDVSAFAKDPTLDCPQ